MSIKLRFYCVIILLGTVSCKRDDQVKLENAFDTAGSNHLELKKVIEYYSKPEDSLKRKAAEYLINNMSNHFGYDGEDLKKYSVLFSAIDTASFLNNKMTEEDKMHVGDSLILKFGQPNPERAEKVIDAQVISANYLISNIEFAFKAWKEAPWYKDVSFYDFCEYILPYRLRNEKLEYWRPEFYNEYINLSKTASDPKNMKSVYEHLHWHLNEQTSFSTKFNKYYPFQQGVEEVLKGRVGGCETFSFFSVIGMRAAGLPVVLDYLPNWGNVSSRHFMTRLIDHKIGKRISNRNTLENTWGIIEFSSELRESAHKFTNQEMPEGMYIQNVKTIPKVYRFTFSDGNGLAFLDSIEDRSLISPEFRQAHIKDVTGEYIENSNVKIIVNAEFEDCPLLYLSVFDLDGWKPVAVSKIRYGTARFPKMGKNVMYIPTIYKNGIHQPAGRPFYIDQKNKIHIIRKTARRSNVKLFRKTALFSYTAFHTELLKEGRFEGANAPDFSDAALLFHVNYYPFYMNEVAIHIKNKFRYLRYVAPPGEHWEAVNIAEVQFYPNNQSNGPLTGKFIGINGKEGHGIDKAFDNDMDTFYENSQLGGGWIGLDLGEGKEQVISKIKFSPRSDTNCIMPGKEYELFYWDGSWISLGIKEANEYNLQFKNVPSGVLFWLKCNSGGTEERVFTYENGIQIWW